MKRKAMKTNKPTTVWWVEPNYMWGIHKVHVSVFYMNGRTIEVSHLVPQLLLDRAALPQSLIGHVISSMQSTLNGVITGSDVHDNK